jgi:PleD family two-component response regulator
MNARIMIIDAHPVYAPKVAAFLESLTFKNILVVSSGLKVLEAVIEFKPDLIILSATLPDTESCVLAAQIKAKYFSIPLILQIGLLTTSQTVEIFKSLGVDYVVPRREKDWSLLQKSITDALSLMAI